MSVKWYGDRVKRKYEKAQEMGVDWTMLAAVRHAKHNHPWQNRTGTLQASIEIQEGARYNPQDGAAVGRWGTGIKYAVPLEFGGFPFIRPAADAEYPNLLKNVKLAAKFL